MKQPREDAATLRDQGIAAVEEGRVEEALRLWLSAWEKQPGDGDLACDIGRAALMSGDPIAAMRWLTRCVNLLPDATTPDAMRRRRTEVIDLAVARARVATLLIETEPGAALSVDGREIGQSPPSEPTFVLPGEHRIEAQKGARRATAFVNGKAGETYRIALPLGPDEAPLIPRPEAPPISSSSALSMPKVPAPSGPPPRDFVWWPIFAGSTLASVGLTTGIVLRLGADQAEARRRELEKQIVTESPGNACGKDLWWHGMCDAQSDLTEKSWMYSTASTALFIVGGAAAAGALSFAAYEMGRLRVTPTIAGVAGSYQW
jgi:hypothetical protein